MGHTWVNEVLMDLSMYAVANGLPNLAAAVLQAQDEFLKDTNKVEGHIISQRTADDNILHAGPSASHLHIVKL